METAGKSKSKDPEPDYSADNTCRPQSGSSTNLTTTKEHKGRRKRALGRFLHVTESGLRPEHRVPACIITALWGVGCTASFDSWTALHFCMINLLLHFQLSSERKSILHPAKKREDRTRAVSNWRGFHCNAATWIA